MQLVALLEQRNGEMIPPSDVIRFGLQQVAEDLDGIVGEVLLYVDPAEGIRNVGVVGEFLFSALSVGEGLIEIDAAFGHHVGKVIESDGVVW